MRSESSSSLSELQSSRAPPLAATEAADLQSPKQTSAVGGLRKGGGGNLKKSRNVKVFNPCKH